MTTKSWKRVLGVAVFVGMLALVFGVPSSALAQEGPGWLDCLGSPTTCAIYYVSYTVNTSLGFLVAVAAWLMGMAFTLTLGAIDLPAVQIGFAFTLSFANLGFVLGIIVIAVATILRNQTYGIKKILWKLIVMAILINFSLTIAGTIVNVSDNLSRLFLSQMSPVEGGLGSTWEGVQGFVNALTSAFTPQTLFSPPTETDISKELAAFSRQVFSMLFGTVFMGLMLIIYVAIDVILVIRTIYLALLVVLMPFAWLSWVFPISQKNWTEWWDKFLKWVYFPPIALFFLYLAILTIQTKSFINCVNTKGSSLDTVILGAPPRNCGDLQKAVGSNGIGSTVAVTLGKLTGNQSQGQDNGLLAGAAQMIIVAGLAIGGLFAAQKVGAAGAGVTMDAAKAAGKGFGSWGWQKSSGALARYATMPKSPPPPGASLLQRARNLIRNPLQGILAPPAAKEQAKQQVAQRAAQQQAAALLPAALQDAQEAQRTAEEKRRNASAARQATQDIMLAGHAPDSSEVQRAVAAANAAEREAQEAEENAAKKKSAVDELEARTKGPAPVAEGEGEREEARPAPGGAAAAPAVPTGGGGVAPAAVATAPAHSLPTATVAPAAGTTSAHPPTAPVAPLKPQKKPEGVLGPKNILKERPLFDYDLLSKDILELAGKRLAKGFLRSVGAFPRSADAKGLRERLAEIGQERKLNAPTLLGATFGSAIKVAWRGAFKPHGVHLSKKDQEAIAHALNIHLGGHEAGGEHKKEGKPKEEDHAAGATAKH